jgi:hypothetical protein
VSPCCCCSVSHFLLSLASLDIVSADIDLNGTGLLRLTLIKDSRGVPPYSSSNGTDSSLATSSSRPRHLKSPSHEQYSYLIMKCLSGSGHPEAVEWLKELHRIKFDLLQNISIYRQRVS